MDDLGSRIKEARMRRGLTQKDLAKCICKCPSAVSGYENNTQIPPAETMISLASVLNVSLDYLVNNDPTYSVKGLTQAQQAIIFDIVAEFRSPTGLRSPLSDQQMAIIRKLICQFYRAE